MTYRPANSQIVEHEWQMCFY